MPCIRQSDDDSQHVGWRGEEEGLDVIVLQSRYHSSGVLSVCVSRKEEICRAREKVGDRASCNDSEEQNHQNVRLRIRECKLQSRAEGLLAFDPIILSDILFQSPNR